MSHYFKNKLHLSQQSFLKTKSTTNLVTYFDFTFPIVSSQCQFDSIYSDFGHAFDNVLQTQKFCASGLSNSYIKWSHSYLTNQTSSVRISDTFLSFLGCPTMILFFFNKSLMTSVK